VCVCVYIHTYIHTYIYIYIHIRSQAPVPVHRVPPAPLHVRLAPPTGGPHETEPPPLCVVNTSPTLPMLPGTVRMGLYENVMSVYKCV
jgi:hypothetical protein